MNIFSAKSLDIEIENLRQNWEIWNNGNPSSYTARILDKQLQCLRQMRDNILELQEEEEYIESEYDIS